MLFLFFLDLLSVFFAYYFATLTRFGVTHNPTFWSSFGVLFIITFSVFLYQNLYDRKRYVNQTELFLKLILSSFYAVVIYIIFTFFTKFYFLELSRVIILLFFFYFLILNIVFRILLAPFVFERWFADDRRKKRVIIRADKKGREKIITMFDEHPVLGFKFCNDKKEKCTDVAFLWCDEPDLGKVYGKIEQALKKYPVVEAIIPVFQRLRMEIGWTRIGDKPVWEFNRERFGKLSDTLIRILDIIVSVTLLIILGIPMLIIALIIRFDSGSPVIFKQERVGKDGKVFTFLKFRSMKNGIADSSHRKYMKTLINGEQKDGEIFKKVDEKKLTRFGRFLRKTSIDELPQLFNVLKGDMSIVGPRPPIPYEVKMYKDWHKERLKIKPGITGTWQVFGRSSLPFDESVFLDLYYKENRCCLLNLYLFLKTIPRVINSIGAE